MQLHAVKSLSLSLPYVSKSRVHESIKLKMSLDTYCAILQREDKEEDARLYAMCKKAYALFVYFSRIFLPDQSMIGNINSDLAR